MRIIITAAILLGLSAASVKAGRLGGPNLDAELDHEWKTYIRDQGFPTLPHSSKMPKLSATDTIETRQRYILRMHTSSLNPRIEKGDDGYFQMLYASKEQGNFLLVVHEKFKDCLKDARKKFDAMEWIAFSNGSYDTEDGKGLQSIVVEKPRQCVGNYGPSGGKLKKAK